VTILFDTSVLVAALSRRHLDHARALAWFERAVVGDVRGAVSTHSLAELYSTLTGHPAWKVSPTACHEVMKENLKNFQVVSIKVKDYWSVIQRMSRLALPGGAIYDALHAQVALEARMDSILTLNAKHFSRLGLDVARLVEVP
jgi:predicted nucleic acid-binding protein